MSSGHNDQAAREMVNVGAILRMLPPLPERGHISVTLRGDGEFDVSVHGCTPAGLRERCEIHGVADSACGRDSYGNLQWVEVEVNGVEITYFL